MTNLETLLLAMLGNKGGGGEGGTTNYNELDNRPQVNGVTLTGNKNSKDLNLVDINMIGASDGAAALDGEGKVPKSQLPPYPNYDTEIQNINQALDDKVDETELSSAINDVKTNILSTVVASSNASTSNAKTLDFQGTGKNLEKLVIEGKTVQDGTPSPSSPVEVKGVGDGGWNIMPFAKKETKSQNGVTIASDGYGTYTLSGTASASTEIFFDIPEFVVPKSIGSGGKSKLYFFNTKAYSGSATVSIRFYNASTRIDGYTLATTNRTDSSNTALNEQIVNRISFPVSSGCVTNLTVSPMVTNDGNTTHDFSAGGKYEIPISSGGKSTNIYLNAPLFDGDKADVVSGVAEKKYGIKVFDGSESWEYRKTSGTNYNYFILNDIGVSNVKKNVPVTTNIVKGTSVEPAAENAYISSGGALAIFTQNAGDTADTFKEFLRSMNSSGNPVYMIYPLATTTKETFDAPTIATVVGKNTLTVGTEVAPTKIEATSFGEYYSKAEVDKRLNGEWVDVDVSNVVPRDTAAGYSVDLTGNNHIRFKKINNIIYVDIQLKISCTDSNVVSIYFKNVVPQQFFSNTAKVLPSRMSNWVNINDNYRGLAWFQVDPNTNAISISLADNKKMVTANGMLFNCYSNYFAD